MVHLCLSIIVPIDGYRSPLKLEVFLSSMIKPICFDILVTFMDSSSYFRLRLSSVCRFALFRHLRRVFQIVSAMIFQAKYVVENVVATIITLKITNSCNSWDEQRCKSMNDLIKQTLSVKNLISSASIITCRSLSIETIYLPTLRGLIWYFFQPLNFLRNSWENSICFDNGMPRKFRLIQILFDCIKCSL